MRQIIDLYIFKNLPSLKKKKNIPPLITPLIEMGGNISCWEIKQGTLQHWKRNGTTAFLPLSSSGWFRWLLEWCRWISCKNWVGTEQFLWLRRWVYCKESRGPAIDNEYVGQRNAPSSHSKRPLFSGFPYHVIKVDSEFKQWTTLFVFNLFWIVSFLKSVKKIVENIQIGKQMLELPDQFPVSIFIRHFVTKTLIEELCSIKNMSLC